MEIKNNITVYKCDHCSKKLFRKQAMAAHELRCSKNPENIRACFGCANLERVDIEFETTVQTYDYELRKGSCFRCRAKNIFMHPPKLEYNEKGVPVYTEFEGEEIEQEKMPLLCELRVDEFEEINEMFNR